MKEQATGIFELTHPVPNPEKDGRVKTDWTRMDFEPGTYRVKVERVAIDEERHFSYHCVEKIGESAFKTVTSGTPAGKTLLAALSPKEKSVETILREESVENCHSIFYIKVLTRLVTAGQLNLEDFEAAVIAQNEEEK